MPDLCKDLSDFYLLALQLMLLRQFVRQKHSKSISLQRLHLNFDWKLNANIHIRTNIHRRAYKNSVLNYWFFSKEDILAFQI